MTRFISFTPSGWQDYLYWQTQDRKTIKRINQLIRDIVHEPFAGLGKPEPLRDNLSGFWSRRIDDPNHIVYAVDKAAITIVSCRLYSS